MTLTEDDKDIIIKLLARQIILYQENMRLRELLSENDIKLVPSRKSVKVDERELDKHSNAEANYEVENILTDDSWNSISDGTFDDELESLLQSGGECETGGKDKTESEDENDECG